LSNLIKTTQYVPLEEIFTFHSREGRMQSQAVEAVDEAEAADEAGRFSRRIIEDAELVAEECITRARMESEDIRARAEQEIAAWWEQRRSEDEAIRSRAFEEGYRQGLEAGRTDAERAVRAENESLISEARALLERAHRRKREIIQEAEPFLIELSCAIAEKIIGRQLTLSPEWIADFTRSVLNRRKEKGTVTLCVAPQHFPFLQSVREELLSALDSQAELQILPDPGVKDHGCIVRSAFGSIDARIDTQLQEIKAVLKQAALAEEGAAEDG